MPYLRHRSFVLAPASPSFNTPIICSSVNRFDFMVRSHVGGLYSWAVLFAGITSRALRPQQAPLRKSAPTEDDVGVDPMRSSHFRDRCPRPARLLQDPQLLRYQVLAPRPRAAPETIRLAYHRGVHVAPTRTPTTCPLSPWTYNPLSR